MTADRDTYRTLLVDAFAEEPMAGVATGVVPEADGLSTEQMRAMATELGAGTTAFVRPSVDGDRRLRAFTPSGECDRRDDAILAAYAQRHAESTIDAGSYAVDAAGALVDVEVDRDGTVWVAQSVADVRTVDLDYDRAGTALGIDPATLRDVGADVPAAIASTGEPFLLVPVNFLSALSGADPAPNAIATLCDEYEVAGIYAFTFDTLSADATLHARAFTPGSEAGRAVLDSPGIATAAGACGAYIQRADAFDEPPEETVIEQGHFRDRASRIRVRAGDPVHVGGHAVTSLDGRLAVPAQEDDDIVEA